MLPPSDMLGCKYSSFSTMQSVATFIKITTTAVFRAPWASRHTSRGAVATADRSQARWNQASNSPNHILACRIWLAPRWGRQMPPEISAASYRRPHWLHIGGSCRQRTPAWSGSLGWSRTSTQRPRYLWWTDRLVLHQPIHTRTGRWGSVYWPGRWAGRGTPVRPPARALSFPHTRSITFAPTCAAIVLPIASAM